MSLLNCSILNWLGKCSEVECSPFVKCLRKKMKFFCPLQFSCFFIPRNNRIVTKNDFMFQYKCLQKNKGKRKQNTHSRAQKFHFRFLLFFEKSKGGCPG